MAKLGEANIGGRMVPAWLMNITAEELDSLKSRWYSNPNLLDNWYLENPVDQRQGYVVQPGKLYQLPYDPYTEIGTTDQYYTVDYIDSSNNPHFKIDGTEYFVDSNRTSQAYVRGYTRSMHTIDRWAIYEYTSGAIALTHNGINISGSFDFGTVIEMSRMPDDSPITASFLFNDGFYSFTVANKYTFGAAQIDSGGAQCVWLPNWPTAEAGTGLFFVNGNSFPSINRTFIAAKLELGSQQTLAHQDADGNWRLNEIPDYGEQLARCQRYYRQFNAYAKFIAQYIDGTKVVFVLPVSMRTAPGMTGGWKVYTGFTAQTGFTLNTYQTGNIIVVEAVKENHGLTSAWLGVDSSGVGILNAEL